MKINRNAPCTCGSGKKFKKCCINWQENWRATINNTLCEKKIKNIFRGTFDFIAEYNYQGGCHLLSAIMHILLNESGYNSIVKIGEVQIGNYVFDHSWIELDGKVIDVAIMNTMQDGIRFPPVLLGNSVASGKEINYEYGVPNNLDEIAQKVLGKSIGHYIMEGESQGAVEIMRDILNKADFEFDDLENLISKYINKYRVLV
ncbi:SEC-C metal-binding domain-containing protein [Niallia alba]|uniref:YecA family protein n=1 Tax=Niallia alba TaxID=2729105 RepID=UPI002E1A0C3D|nr:SEC-C metal-binding domain-containing protein [Niallia alba]